MIQRVTLRSMSLSVYSPPAEAERQSGANPEGVAARAGVRRALPVQLAIPEPHPAVRRREVEVHTRYHAHQYPEPTAQPRAPGLLPAAGGLAPLLHARDPPEQVRGEVLVVERECQSRLEEVPLKRDV